MDHVAAKGRTQLSSVLPFRLNTADDPAGMEQAAFDKTALALNEDRPKVLAGFCRTFLGVDTEQDPVSEGRLTTALIDFLGR